VRRLLIILIVVVGLLVAADYGARVYSQSVVGTELQDSLALSQKPSVSFGGWPFLPHLLSGDLPSASFSADTFTANGVGVRAVHVTLDDLHFPSKRLIMGGGGKIHAKTGHGTASMTGADVTGALHNEGLPLDVTIHNGRAQVGGHGITVGLDVRLIGDRVLLTPAATTIPPATFTLPTIVHGLSYTSLQVRGSAVVLSFVVTNAVFVVPSS
jgi:LmeA-like phospholipid-binding